MNGIDSLFDDSTDRAVSPVIGVILMVAITVILAAVIGTFVLNLSDQTGQTTPQASLSVSDGADSHNATGNYSAIAIDHGGGAELPYESFEIVVRNTTDNAEVASWDDGEWSDSTGENLSVDMNGDQFESGDILSNGDRLTILGNGNGSEPLLQETTQYEVSIVDKESGSDITAATITVR